jgi:N-acetylmuramic acid 6-phosphate (MurNAc-6-P) etherase
LQLLGGLLRDVLGVTVAILDVVVAAIASGITPYFAGWLTNGTGAALADGCMGSPSLLGVLVSLQ